MQNFIARDGHFWLGDQPQLIQAGEFHYFRTPKNQWQHRLDLLKDAGFNALATYIPWLWHQLDEDLSDFDGHSHPMRDLEGFLDLVAAMGFWIIARPGPYIMAETINEGIPPWVFKKYPQAAFISQEKKTQNIASYLHPDFLACISKWYKAVFSVLAPRQISRGGKIIMIQLDNEMGMMAWVRNIMDTNLDTMDRFATYITHTYGEDMPIRYPAKDLKNFLQDGIVNPREPYAEKIVEDYRSFYRKYLREYALFLLSEARLNGLEVPPVINIHGFANGGKTFPIGLSQLIEVMRIDGMISATDVYPGHIGEGNFHELLLVNEITKALQNEQQPLFSIEFQCGGNLDFGNTQSSMYDLHTRLCISCGMRAINHYLFFAGENDPILSPVKRHDWGPPVRKDGSLRNHYFRYPKLSMVLKSYGRALIESRPETITTIGFQLDNFMTEVGNAFSKEATRVITHQRDTVLFDMLARGLSLTHRPYNIVELDSGNLDAKLLPLCWVMMDKQCNAEVQQKLLDYVKQGGKLVLAGRLCVENFSHQPCTILKDALGVQRICDDQPFTNRLIQVFEHLDAPVSFLETYTGDFDEVFARGENGEIAGFIKHIGSGTVLVFGAAMLVESLEDLDIVHQIALKMGCPPLFHPSPWVDLRLSRGERGNFLFVANYQDDPVETRVTYRGGVLFGGHPLSLPARRGLILPLDWQVNENITIHYATSEILEIIDAGSQLEIRTAQDEFYAEISLRGIYRNHPTLIQPSDDSQRVNVHGKEGKIVLNRSD